ERYGVMDWMTPTLRIVSHATSVTQIGYNIRLDRSESESTQVLFVTPGILLRKLESDPLLDAHTHIIIDEAHERDRFTEFIMIVMKDILPQRPDLKLILMSA